MSLLYLPIVLFSLQAQKYIPKRFFIDENDFGLKKIFYFSKRIIYEKRKIHILYSQTTLSGLYTESKTFSTSGAFQVSSCLFIECQSMTKKGGALLVDLSSGSLTMQHTAFYNCISGLQGGGIFFQGQTTKITYTCFFGCQAATHDSCYFKATALFSLQSDVSIYSSAPSDKFQNGPNLEITGDTSTIKVLNMTANHADQKSNSGALQLTTSGSSTVSHSEFLSNSANYIVYTSAKLAVNYCNFVDNIFSTAVFGVEKNKVNLAYDIIVGPDPKSSSLLSNSIRSSQSSFLQSGKEISRNYISTSFLSMANNEKQNKQKNKNEFKQTNYLTQSQEKLLINKINHGMNLEMSKNKYNNKNQTEISKQKHQQTINMNTRDVVAVLLNRGASFTTFGCMISYRRINSSVVAGPIGQFEKINVVTVAIPTFGNEECLVMINAVASKGYTGITFPVSVNNIAALTVVGLIVIAVLFFVIWLECKNVLQKKAEFSNENATLN